MLSCCYGEVLRCAQRLALNVVEGLVCARAEDIVGLSTEDNRFVIFVGIGKCLAGGNLHAAGADIVATGGDIVAAVSQAEGDVVASMDSPGSCLATENDDALACSDIIIIITWGNLEMATADGRVIALDTRNYHIFITYFIEGNWDDNNATVNENIFYV